MHKRVLTKPDGRRLILYGRAPLQPDIQAPSPGTRPTAANPHLRWHPLRGEWVAYAAHRQDRTFLPPARFNPFAPSTDPSTPTEVPAGNWDVVVFENRFPALSPDAHDPPASLVDTMPARGACEVIVYAQDPSISLGELSLDHLDVLLEAWADRYVELGQRDDVQYVMPFENRGVEVGATLHHPHGQIYAYPFVPPIPARELTQQRVFLAEHGRGLLAGLLAAELIDGRRVIHRDASVIAFVPAWARYPYEVWITPLRPAPSLADLDTAERRSFAATLRSVVRTYDAFWGSPFPYVMVFHQAPTDGRPHPEAHLHVEFYPPYRMPGRLKYLAGTELGAGLFANDRLPEETAAELRAANPTPRPPPPRGEGE